MFSRSLPTFPLALLLSSLLSAQATLLVGPGGFPDLQSAIVVAQSGDEIVVAPGDYPAFVCSIGVTIRAAQPGTVSILTAPLPLVLIASATRPVRLIGLQFEVSVAVSNVAVFDECSFVGQTVLQPTGATVHLERCSIRGLPSAIISFGHVRAIRQHHGYGRLFDGYRCVDGWNRPQQRLVAHWQWLDCIWPHLKLAPDFSGLDFARASERLSVLHRSRTVPDWRFRLRLRSMRAAGAMSIAWLGHAARRDQHRPAAGWGSR